MGFTSIETANRMAAVEKKRKQGGDVIGTLTLRDYFAAKAMQALIASAPSGTSFGVSCEPTNNTFSRASYALADGMLKAREQ